MGAFNMMLFNMLRPFIIIASITVLVSCASSIKPKEIKLTKDDLLSSKSDDFLSLGELKYLGRDLSIDCRQGNEEEAKKRLLVDYKAKRKDAMYWNRVATCLVELGDLSKAMYYYDFSLMIAKKKTEKEVINNNRAVLYLKLGNTQKAYLILEELKRSNETLVHVNRALLSNEVGHMKKSERVYQSVKDAVKKDQNIDDVTSVLTRKVASTKE